MIEIVMDKYIIDLNGKEIAVTDLSLALMQADDYRHYRVGDPSSYQLHLYTLGPRGNLLAF